MPVGPGKYDELAEHCLKEAQASAVVLIVFDGYKGSGMSGAEAQTIWEVAGGPIILKKLPAVLRVVANSIESDMVGS